MTISSETHHATPQRAGQGLSRRVGIHSTTIYVRRAAVLRGSPSARSFLGAIKTLLPLLILTAGTRSRGFPSTQGDSLADPRRHCSVVGFLAIVISSSSSRLAGRVCDFSFSGEN